MSSKVMVEPDPWHPSFPFVFQVDLLCGMRLKKQSLCWFRERPAPSTPSSLSTWFCKQTLLYLGGFILLSVMEVNRSVCPAGLCCCCCLQATSVCVFLLWRNSSRRSVRCRSSPYTAGSVCFCCFSNFLSRMIHLVGCRTTCLFQKSF